MVTNDDRLVPQGKDQKARRDPFEAHRPQTSLDDGIPCFAIHRSHLMRATHAYKHVAHSQPWRQSAATSE
jgi:hypothetical protein